MTEDTRLTTLVADPEQRKYALLRAIGFDKLNEGERELALNVADRYDLDLLLKHLVIIDGRAYITRDGLLHVAHKSGDFDGIEVTKPVKSEDGKHWESEAAVYRKSFSRPFRYPGRYPVDGRNAKYAQEMAIKVAEVMTLRRAFDVSAPVIEERWAEPDVVETDQTDEPTSLADRVASRVAAIEAEPVETEVVHESTESDEFVPVVRPVRSEPEPASPSVLEPETEAPEDDPERDHEPVTVDVDTGDPETSTVTVIPTPSDLTLEEFSDRVPEADRDWVKMRASVLWPDARKFADLNGDQLEQLLSELAARPAEPVDGDEPLCGDPSPFSDSTCKQLAGHASTVPHRSGLRETW